MVSLLNLLNDQYYYANSLSSLAINSVSLVKASPQWPQTLPPFKSSFGGHFLADLVFFPFSAKAEPFKLT